MIDPQKFYTASEIIKIGKEERLLPIRSRMTLQRLIQSGELLPTIVKGKKRPRYYFKGETLIKYNEAQGVQQETLPIHLSGGEMVQVVRPESN